jgi:type II secretory pathway component PulF
MAKFGRALGALMKGGVSVPRALKLAADSCGNEYIRSMIYPAATKIEDGSGIADTLRGTQVFTPLVLDMLSTGEASGSVDDMLNKVSDYYESEAAVRAQLMGRVTGVVALIVVGIYVGFVVISFFLGAAAQITNEVNR